MTSSRRPKRITDAHITGEAGVGLIALRTAEMGHIWHQRQTDAGIDGKIEVRDADGTVRNLVVMVQSKASDRPFPGKTDHSFHFVVDQRDLDYWLGGNAPVILVCYGPPLMCALGCERNGSSDCVRQHFASSVASASTGAGASGAS